MLRPPVDRVHWPGPKKLRKSWGPTAAYGGAHVIPVVDPERPHGGLAQPHGFFEHRVEYWREVAGRGVDDPKHLGGGGLLLQRLARLGDQPRILDRDDGL